MSLPSGKNPNRDLLRLTLEVSQIPIFFTYRLEVISSCQIHSFKLIKTNINGATIDSLRYFSEKYVYFVIINELAPF